MVTVDESKMLSNMINKNTILTAALLLTGFAFQANAQTTLTASGTVKDVYGNPLPGVIVSAGHKDLYVTDKEGQYTVAVDPDERLAFSLLGFKRQEVRASSGMDVVLEDDAHGLAEHVNLGYARQYREVVSDAVTTASGEDLGKSLMSRLQGTFSGRFSGLTTIENSFEPTYESVAMYIRGLSTVHGGAAGIVVDGILYDSYSHDILYRISPEEVESVSVLKDGASQALYGVKGANGLIVINTKRGIPGKLKIGVNVSETIERPTQRIHAFDSYTYATLRNQAAFNDGRGSNLYFSEEAIKAFKEGGNPLYPDTNWSDMLFRDFSTMQRVAVDATGGNQTVRYYAVANVLRQGSFWHTDQQDYKADNEKYRINFRSNIDVNVNRWISLYMNLAGSIVKAHTPNGSVASNGAIYTLLACMPPTVYGAVTPEVFDAEGNLLMKAGEVISTVNMVDSPYGELNRSGYNNQTNTNIYGQGGVKLDLSFLTPGLWAGGSIGYLSYITATLSNRQNYARYYRDEDWSRLNFTQLGTTQNTNLQYSKGEALYGYMSYKAEAGYARDFGRHHVKADAYGIYQVFDDITGNVGSTYDFRRVYSGAEAMYDFDRRYALKFSAGYSGSDYFPRATRFIWTPGVSAAWIASNESFVRDRAPWLSLLKVRGSWAVTGNDDTGWNRYDYRDQVKVSGAHNVGYLGYHTDESVYGNSGLSPEKITKWNAGIDLGIANRFSVSFDLFKERMDNGIVKSTALIPSYQGISLGSYPITNMAEYENRGWELSVGFNHRFNADWGLFINGHVGYNRNKVISVGESAYDDTYAYPIRMEGRPYGQSWGYLVDWSNGNGLYNFQDEIDAGPEYSFGTPRLGDIKYRDLNKDGRIDEKDQAPIGNGALPRYSFGLDLGFTYRNIEVSLLFQGVGDYFRNYQGLCSIESNGDGVFTESHLGAWTPEKWLNDEEITYPALSTTKTTNTQTNDFFLKDASFVRLKNAEISYRLPRRFSDFVGAGTFKVYLSGQNLFTLDKMKTRDMPVEGNVLAFPVYRMYRIGVHVSF